MEEEVTPPEEPVVDGLPPVEEITLDPEGFDDDDNGLDEDGNPIEDEEEADPSIAAAALENAKHLSMPPVDGVPAAVPAPVVAPVAAVPADAPSVYAPPAPPTEWTFNKVPYPVSADGFSLHDPVFEDEDSAEADALVTSMIESMGEEAAAAAYANAKRAYQTAKGEYESRRLGDVEQSFQTTGRASLVAQINRTHEKVTSEYLGNIDAEDRDALIASYQPQALALITQERRSAVDTLMRDHGMSARAAAARVDATILSTPDIYERALGSAVVANLKDYTEAVERAIYKKLGVAYPGTAAAAPAAVPPKPATAPAAARPTPPPGISGSSPARAPGAEQRINVRDDERKMAESFGIKPNQMERYVKELRAQKGMRA